MSFSYNLPSPCRYVTTVKRKLCLDIDPEFQHVPVDGVYEYLCSKRKKFVKEFGGILLDWEIHKLRTKSKGSPPFSPEINVKGSFRIVKVEDSERLIGTVLEVRPSHFLCRTLGIFCVKVDISDSEQLQVLPGDELEYTLVDFAQDGRLGVLKGKDPAVVTNSIRNVHSITQEEPVFLDESMSDSQIVSQETSTLQGISAIQKIKRKLDDTPVSDKKRKKTDTFEVNSTPVIKTSVSTPTAKTPTAKTPAANTPAANTPIVNTPTPTTPAKKSATLTSASKTANTFELPAGWERIKHVTEKNTWYTFVSPAGKKFKSLKLVQEHIAKENGDAPAKAYISSSEIDAIIEKVVTKYNRGPDNQLKTVSKLFPDASVNGEIDHMANGDDESFAEEKFLLEPETILTYKEDTSADLRSSLLDNLQTKIKLKKKKKDKTKNDVTL